MKKSEKRLLELLSAMSDDEGLIDLVMLMAEHNDDVEHVISFIDINSITDIQAVVDYARVDHKTIADDFKQKRNSSEALSWNPLFLPKVQITPDLPCSEYYSDLPVVQSIWRENGLIFKKPITIFVGENGIGKSTLIEALAISVGFNAEGGSLNFSFSTKASHSTLYKYMKVTRGTRRNTDGFFLRAESFYNAATYLENIDDDHKAFKSYGYIPLHEQSHGESFLALVENRFSSNGLYILGEPEAALSPMRLMRMMVTIHELADHGAQFIISTHSPILMTLPKADIIQFSEEGLMHVSYRETEHFQVSLAFLQNPDRMLNELLDKFGGSL